jgi:hypothetical protein
MNDSPRDRPHLFINGGGQTEQYRRPAQAIRTQPLPFRDRAAHADALSASIGVALEAARAQLGARAAAMSDGVPGFYLQIEVPASERAVIDQLGNRPKKIEVVSVREPSADNPSVVASVFVPATAETYYLEKVEAYRVRETATGRPANEPLVARLETVRLATAKSLFTDDDALFPIGDGAVWWEIWLRDGHREVFLRMAARLNLQVKDHAVRFPEREVVLALASTESIDRLVAYSDVVAELRRAKDTPAFFMGLDGGEQREWSDDALARLTPPADANVAVCILDSGVTQAHPLLSPALDIADLHTINPAWGTTDSATQWRGHGTAMAGTALYGDLVPALTGGGAIVLTHRLESVKILPPNGVGNNEPDLYGAITAEAIARAEIQAPNRRRAIVLAVTSESSMRGRPSSWSSTIDQLCFDPDNRRLLIVSAGNIRVDLMPADHLIRNDVESVEDPAHAWNALAVGAFTEKVDLIDPTLAGWTAIAPAGELSPRSRTSVTWERQWPVKPDVVLEGGNLASNGVLPGDPVDDLQLLTTHNRPNDRVFNTIGDTSAATALVARLAGSILATRPRLWPETVRGLIVHSAEWTDAMRVRINGCNGTKRNIHALVRRYGYGVPDLGRALMSAQNDLTLMVEDTLTPFNKEGSASVKTRDMKVHQLPWPNDVLVQLGDAHVELRVTLSYFIEPNPGERGWTRRHRYASHGLRFAVKKATESLDDFRARVNDAARDEEEGEAVGGGAGGDEWLLGPKYRDQGSLHSDFWSGTAADLAQRDAIGVFPVGGWWKEKPYLEKWDTKARYSLIVTIKAPGVEVDIYTPVEAKIAIAAEIG